MTIETKGDELGGVLLLEISHVDLLALLALQPDGFTVTIKDMTQAILGAALRRLNRNAIRLEGEPEDSTVAEVDLTVPGFNLLTIVELNESS